MNTFLKSHCAALFRAT